MSATRTEELGAVSSTPLYMSTFTHGKTYAYSSQTSASVLTNNRSRNIQSVNVSQLTPQRRVERNRTMPCLTKAKPQRVSDCGTVDYIATWL